MAKTLDALSPLVDRFTHLVCTAECLIRQPSRMIGRKLRSVVGILQRRYLFDSVHAIGYLLSHAGLVDPAESMLNTVRMNLGVHD